MAHTIVSTTSTPSVAPAARRIPLWLKLAYTAFMAVLVPVYLRNYGPTNFLYFCDVALIITLVGIWIESPLLVSICAVGVIASQTLWVIDFLSNLIDHPLTGLTNYMFMADHSLIVWLACMLPRQITNKQTIPNKSHEQTITHHPSAVTLSKQSFGVDTCTGDAEMSEFLGTRRVRGPKFVASQLRNMYVQICYRF